MSNFLRIVFIGAVIAVAGCEQHSALSQAGAAHGDTVSDALEKNPWDKKCWADVSKNYDRQKRCSHRWSLHKPYKPCTVMKRLLQARASGEIGPRETSQLMKSLWEQFSIAKPQFKNKVLFAENSFVYPPEVLIFYESSVTFVAVFEGIRSGDAGNLVSLTSSPGAIGDCEAYNAHLDEAGEATQLFLDAFCQWELPALAAGN